MITCQKVMQVLEKSKNLWYPKVRNVLLMFEQEHFSKWAHNSKKNLQYKQWAHNSKKNLQYKPLADPSYWADLI